MGCDIHLKAEKRRADGTWRLLPDPIKKCWSCDGKKVYGPDAHADYVGKTCMACEGKGERRDSFYSGRNYRLFAVLADVRNGYGIEPIRQCRGIPKNASPGVRNEAERWNGDGHSASWYTLEELLDYDWGTTVMRDGGWVSPRQYAEFKERGRPTGWCKSVGGGSVRHISNEEMEAHVAQLRREGKPLPDEFGGNLYTEVEWSETVGHACENFLVETVPLLKELAGDDPTSVRVVFFFDN